jgi:hypothetical protein
MIVFGDDLRRRRTAFATYTVAFLCVAAILIEARVPNAGLEFTHILRSYH